MAAAVLAEFLSGALGSVITKVFIFPFETARVILAVRKDEYQVRLYELGCCAGSADPLPAAADR